MQQFAFPLCLTLSLLLFLFLPLYSLTRYELMFLVLDIAYFAWLGLKCSLAVHVADLCESVQFLSLVNRTDLRLFKCDKTVWLDVITNVHKPFCSK